MPSALGTTRSGIVTTWASWWCYPIYLYIINQAINQHVFGEPSTPFAAAHFGKTSQSSTPVDTPEREGMKEELKDHVMRATLLDMMREQGYAQTDIDDTLDRFQQTTRQSTRSRSGFVDLRNARQEARMAAEAAGEPDPFATEQ